MDKNLNRSQQISHACVPHCKDKIPKFLNKYSQKRNIGASVTISTFICLWAIYVFPRWVCLFCWRKYVDRSWDYTNRSQTHECWNWGWGRAIPRKGINIWDFRCSALTTCIILTNIEGGIFVFPVGILPVTIPAGTGGRGETAVSTNIRRRKTSEPTTIEAIERCMWMHTATAWGLVLLACMTCTSGPTTRQKHAAQSVFIPYC